MFDKKIKYRKASKTNKNRFIAEAVKQGLPTMETLNGAKVYETSGSQFVDQFMSASHWLIPRDIKTIFKDMDALWAEDPHKAIRFTLYLRAITRKTELLGSDTKSKVRGQGLRWESQVRMLYIASISFGTFMLNLPLFLSVGSWRDFFDMWYIDLMYHEFGKGVLDVNFMANFFHQHADNIEDYTLLASWMPAITSGAKNARGNFSQKLHIKNIVAKFLAKRLFPFSSEQEKQRSYKKWRELKSAKNPKTWQKLISQGRHKEVDFSTIHGKALSRLVNSKYLANQGKYDEFLEFAKTSEAVRTTSYAHEILKPLFTDRGSCDYAQVQLMNKQFVTLVEKAKLSEEGALLPVIDISGSMNVRVVGTDVSAIHIAKSIALYLSYLLKGEFNNSYMTFARQVTFNKWQGTTPMHKYLNQTDRAIGNTNFRNVITFLIELKKKGVPLEDFPKGIICISDGEFDPDKLNRTNVEAARSQLRLHFPKEFANSFKIILWNLGRVKAETHFEAPNTAYFSGFDPTAIEFALGDFKSPEDVMNKALNQELFQRAVI